MWYNTSMDKRMIVWAALAVLTVMNAAAFALMAHDKRCARRGKWRVPERTLFLVTACFGGLGGVMGMQLLRHKTKHWYFRVFFPLMLLAQIALLILGVWMLYGNHF